MAVVCAVTLTGCDNIDHPVSSYVQFDQAELFLLPGQVVQNAAVTISTEKITYTSSDKSVVTIDPNGFVTAIGTGEATITASVPATEYYEAGSATCKVTVGSELAKALMEGAEVTILLKDGDEQLERKFVKQGDDYIWTDAVVGVTSYLSYDQSKNLLQFIHAATVIYATPQITIDFDVAKNSYNAYPSSALSTMQFVAIKIGGKDVTSKLEKVEVAAKGVVITGAETPFEMSVGDDVELTALVSPVDATVKKVTWTSTAPAVATVNEMGVVHAVAEGTATIKVATANGKEASIELTVKTAGLALSITNPQVGQVIGDDGVNYAYNNMANGVTAVALITLVNGNNGVAMALADESSPMNWATAQTTCAAHAPAFSNGTWRLPTKDEYDNMFLSMGGDPLDLCNAFSAVGGTNMASSTPYWSSTEYDSSIVWTYKFSGAMAGWAGAQKTASNVLARACLVF